MKSLNVLFKFEKHFAIRPSVFKFNLKRTVIFCKKNFSSLQP